MPIQFQCAGCGQPIEVDDAHAGQAAQCPYCRRVVTVPQETTLAAQPVAARAAGLPPLPTGAAGRGPLVVAARSWGAYALVCTLLAWGLYVGLSVFLMPELMRRIPPETASVELVQKELNEILTGRPWLAALPCGTVFFGLIGAVLSVVSVSYSRRQNWPGLGALCLSGLLTLLLCSGLIFS